MIADGVAIDDFSLLKIKFHLVQALGFPNTASVPSFDGQTFRVDFGDVKQIPEVAFPCVNELLSILDSHHTSKVAHDIVPSVQDGKPPPLLVGSMFVDVSLNMFCNVEELSSFPALTLKSMTEALGVVVYKHDVEHRELKHLQQLLRRAVLRALDFLLLDIAYEIRQVILSVIQAFIKRWSSIAGAVL